MRGAFLSLLSFSDFLCGNTVILFYISFRLFRIFWEGITGSLKLSFALSRAFSISGFFSAGASETQRWSLTSFYYKNKGYKGTTYTKIHGK